MTTPFVDDPLLPAAPFLTGPHGADVLEPAIAAAGGELLHAVAKQVIYRPGRDLTVMFAASIAWGGQPPVAETLVAGVDQRGDLAGTVPVEAGDLRVNVWRYPFDPMLPGLTDAVTDVGVAALLGVAQQAVQLQVVSFRACRRAVVRVRQGGADDLYLKVVPPTEVDGLVSRHRALHHAGLAVPEITLVVPERGIVAVRALPGRDLRTALSEPDASVPSAAEIVAVLEQFATVELPDASPVLALLRSAPRHAAMLRLVLPDVGPHLDAVLGALADDDRAAPPRTIHGDLHDAQLRIDDDGRIVGVLDVDGAGPGDPLDDLARLTAHLHALAMLGDGQGLAPGDPRATAYAARMLDEMRLLVDDRVAFDRRVAAALIGLATGPYRSQTDGWQARTHEVLSVATRILEDEKGLSKPS